MNKYITKQQYQEIKDSAYDTDVFHNKLQEYTGITARPYFAYQYLDDDGDFIGDSDNDNLDDLLRAAFIEVRGIFDSKMS